MSQAPAAPPLGRPRWSTASQANPPEPGAEMLLPAFSRGLPGKGAIVLLRPPLSARAASIGSPESATVGDVTQFVWSPIRLKPLLVMATLARQSGAIFVVVSPSVFPAMTELRSRTLPLNLAIPPPSPLATPTP